MSNSSSSEEELYDIDWDASGFDVFDFLDPLVLSPQIQAVLQNDLVELSRLLQEGKSVNVNDNRGNTPLHHAIELQLTSVFDYLIEVEDIRLDAVNFIGETPLLLAVRSSNLYYIHKLLQKGADPNFSSPDRDFYLHKIRDVAITRLFLEHGADIDVQDGSGCTPLFNACERWDEELVHMYIYYGADVTITNYLGFLPFDVCPENVENLFYLTFDQYTEISLVTLCHVITKKSPYLNTIVKLTKNTVYTKKQMKELWEILSSPYYFSKLIRPEVSHELLSMQICLMNCETQTPEIHTFEDIFLIILFECIKEDFHLELEYLCHTFPPDVLTKFVCYSASYGTEVTPRCLNLIYYEFGFCELYRFLLHFAKIEYNCYSNRYWGRNFMPSLTYILNLNINMLEKLQEDDLDEECFARLSKFFNLVKFQDKFPSFFEKFKLGESSAVPSLVELSRNSARQFIISKFNVKKTVQFFTVVHHIPIPNIVKQIITYEKEIYA
ncbi:uncharacterized protein LOC123016432 [Tribolium madens]|uniref:uncharacterized protein LOC123016432 n=1 Tax=Tribolium madens TaxID=41895 RepID=UPI001CF7269D|nr:uncharacterized protein LOC123016432 [Tribolium madens]XP_044272766.1 uncharacterized protein LOC123016432 [Tribolium madens]